MQYLMSKYYLSPLKQNFFDKPEEQKINFNSLKHDFIAIQLFEV